ncbi:DUF6519 domain-containing protein [Micromonospora sp. NPDC047465]|uniref:DUF6519 domain-containing protein n=1 Tax=Micromonospora sp. NPDC047465 TaxID=3154813 RepID=UPI0033E2032D
MQGDFTRWTFVPRRAYRSVLLQQGRVLLDADWNEQAEITAYHDEIRTRDVVGPSAGPLDGAGFAVVDRAGADPKATPWADLRITPGRYYVDGVLAESPVPPSTARAAADGWPLDDQPYARGPVGAQPEPLRNGRYAALLDTWTHHVTADEEPSLREPALGGPDTTTRAQTAWRVRLTDIGIGEGCDDVRRQGRFTEARGTMSAALRNSQSDQDPDPHVPDGTYRRLDNQLYRVQIHDGSPARPTFLWSRENGSVAAGLTALTWLGDGTSAELVLDREGRDEELSIRREDTVEVTSAERELAGHPGFLATVTTSQGLRLQVRFTAAGPESLAALGRAPLVRRWEGPARPVDTGPLDLEGGIVVRFPGGGVYRTGDHWLIPARTARHVYGTTPLAGTITWPTGADGSPQACPPAGPTRHVAALAILTRAADGWTLDADCRRLFPPTSSLVARDVVTLDLAGGDGQEARPGERLPAPVRVVVRNSGQPVQGARVRFEAAGGLLATPDGTAVSGPVPTDQDGIAAVTWKLDRQGATTQTLTATLDPDIATAAPPAVVATGRLSVASEVGWAPGGSCGTLDGVATVKDALDRLSQRKELRLLGGDGQHLRPDDKVLPQPVRVIVDSPCGPVANQDVTATATGGARVARKTGDTPPGTLPATTDTATTTDKGAAEFWWQPDPAKATDTLSLAMPGDTRAPVTVTAQRLPAPPPAATDAGSITWTPPAQCPPLDGVTTVKEALNRLSQRKELRLLGGDGQHLRPDDKVLPQPVRVIVDSPCGPVANQDVTATATGGARVARKTGDTPPGTLPATTDTATTTDKGAAEFWWQPDPAKATDTLSLAMPGDTRAPVTVTAQKTLPGIAITSVSFIGTSEKLQNGQDVPAAKFAKGIHIALDADIDTATVTGNPVVHIYFDLPFPLPGEQHPWITVANLRFWRPLEITTAATITTATARVIQWSPDTQLRTWLTNELPSKLSSASGPPKLPGRLVVEGWAITSGGSPVRHVNNGQQYSQWFMVTK